MRYVLKALFAVVLLLPMILVCEVESAGFRNVLTTIHFGAIFQERMLPEVTAISPPIREGGGYDGQFYAQLALDPGLRRHEELAVAIDAPAYRSRRIGLPALCYAVGFGQPRSILRAYAVANMLVYGMILAVLLFYLKIDDPKDIALTVGLLCQTGCLVSVSRALVDLPAMAIGIVAVLMAQRSRIAWPLVGAMLFVKETMLASMIAFVFSPNENRMQRIGRVVAAGLLTGLLAGWCVYAQSQFTGSEASDRGLSNFTFPGLGMVTKLVTATTAAMAAPTIMGVFEVLAPLSLLVQAGYLVTHRRVNAIWWRFGIGFVLLLFLLNDKVLVEQYAFCRVMLPLSVAFNFLLYEGKTENNYARWYVLGNIGMIGVLLFCVVAWLEGAFKVLF